MKPTKLLSKLGFSFLAIFIFISFAMLTAQNKVSIKERVEIAPKTSITISKALGISRTHTLEIEASWDADVSARLLVNSPDPIYSTGSPLKQRFDGITPGNYYIDFQLCVAQITDSIGSTLVHLIVLVDGAERINARSRFYGGSDEIYQAWVNEVDIWFSTDYYFTLNTRSMGYEGMRFLWFKPLYCCGNEEFSPSSDILTMTISKGTEYASFYDKVTKSRLGTSCSRTMYDLFNVVIATDGILPPPDGASVIVEVTGWKEPHIDSMRINPNSIILTPQPNQISIYGESEISIRPYPSWVRMAKIYIDQGASYGTLCQSTYDENYNTINIYGDTLNDIYIGSEIKFLANEQEPNSPVEVHITAKRTSYTGASVNQFPVDFPITGKDTISGSTTITVEPCKLVVTVTPAVVHQGDTAHIDVKQKLADGTLADVGPDNWITFEIYNTEFGDTLSTMDLSWQDTWIQTYDEPRALFMATQNSSSPDSFKVIILVSANEGTGVGKVLVKKEEGCIRATFATSPLSVGDTTTLQFIYAETNQPVPANKLLDVFIMYADGTNGWLLSSRGDTNVVLNGITQPVKYIAPGSIQEDSLVVNIKAVASAPGSSNGSSGSAQSAAQKRAITKIEGNTAVKSIKGPKGSIIKPQALSLATLKALQEQSCEIKAGTVTKPELKILAHAPWTLWPYLPAEDKGGASRGANLPGYNPKRTFKIQVLDGDKNPLSYKEVKIATTFISQSGGHQHTNGTIELPPGLKQGWFYGQGQWKINPLILTTDAHGVADVELFIASEFSGQYLVTASLVSDASIKDTVNLQVKVPGLMNSKNYATSELLWTFEQKDKEIGANHTSPYWLRPEVCDSLFVAAVKWNDWCTKKGYTGNAILSFNDMSLEWGGAFEYFGKWVAENHHSRHRVGCSVDINGSENFRNNNNSLTRLGRDLDKIMIKQGGHYCSTEPTVHYGFKGQN